MQSRGYLTSLSPRLDPAEDSASASRAADQYVELLAAVVGSGSTVHPDVHVRLPALGLMLAGGSGLALAHARRIGAAARNVGASLTIGTAQSQYTEATLAVATDLRSDYPNVAVSVQAALRRTEEDCAELVGRDVRVRLLCGPGGELGPMPLVGSQGVRRSFVRCLRILMAGSGYPMIVTDDRRLIRIAEALAVRNRRAATSYEFQAWPRRDARRRLALEPDRRLRLVVPFRPEPLG